MIAVPLKTWMCIVLSHVGRGFAVGWFCPRSPIRCPRIHSFGINSHSKL